jgi:hypothetical protein
MGMFPFHSDASNAQLHAPLTLGRMGALTRWHTPRREQPGFTGKLSKMLLPIDRSNMVIPQTRSTRVILAARVAARVAGYLSEANGRGTSLHFTILLENFRDYWVYGFDGQPDSMFQAPSKKLIMSNFYRNRVPGGILGRMILPPPSSRMSEEQFADTLANGAHNFFSSTAHYSFPANIVGRRMLQGEYNSSSFIAGLLLSVCGYVPKVNFPGYQTPGWENPIPAHYFRSGPNGAPR